MSQTLSVNSDAFSSGQVGSKIWLCEELEKLFTDIDYISIYGGWYGITAFLLRSRNNINIKRISSIDIDPACQPVADMINENWLWQDWQFKAFTGDCNSTLTHLLPNPDLIINTSTEHFESMDWWNNIPRGTTVVIQGNNMEHDDHYVHTQNISQFITKYPMKEVLYSGEKEFVYPDWQFTRFMLIGIK